MNQEMDFECLNGSTKTIDAINGIIQGRKHSSSFDGLNGSTRTIEFGCAPPKESPSGENDPTFLKLTRQNTGEMRDISLPMLHPCTFNVPAKKGKEYSMEQRTTTPGIGSTTAGGAVP